MTCEHGFIGPCAECDGCGQIPEQDAPLVQDAGNERYVTADVETGEFYVVSNDESDPTVCAWFVHAGPFITQAEAVQALRDSAS